MAITSNTRAAELDALLARHSAFSTLERLQESVSRGYIPTVSLVGERGRDARELRRLRVLLVEAGVSIFPEATRAERERAGVLRPQRSDPPALLELPQVGDCYSQHINQGTRDGFVIAVSGRRYVAEYAMPAGRIFLRLGDVDTGIERPVSVARLPPWARDAERLLEDELG